MRQYILFITLSLIFITGCKNGNENQNAESDSYYTCPMHPSVVSNKPGSCPVCNMSLVKVEKNESMAEGRKGNFIKIDKHKQALAGIQTDTVQVRNLYPASTILGTVAIDEGQVKTMSSRAKGRIEKLFIKSSGSYLQIGTPLYSIYSEQLLADEKEYLILFEKSKTINSTDELIDDLLSAAKNKLLLWGLSEKQIIELQKTGKASPTVSFYSKEAGYVSEVYISEGMYVEEGSLLIKIISLNQVWVEAQLYSSESTKISDNKSFHIFTEASPDEAYKGVLVYSNPIIEQGRRIQLLRIQVANTKGGLIPGMMVSVSPQKAAQAVLAVPKSAVIQEKMKTAWVKTDHDIFEQRMLKTGTESKYWVEILSGLAPGDIVVTDGAYLINSEFILKSGAGQRHEH